MTTGISFLITLIVTAAAIPILINLAFRFNILDLPDGGRKVHRVATPLLGGIGIYIGVIAGLLSHPSSLYTVFPIFVGGTFIMILGFIDDVKHLSARLRLACQFLIAFGIVACGYRMEFLSNKPFGDVVEIFLTFIWLIGVTNAYNYLDGLDGLCAGSAAINFIVFSIILYATSQYTLGLLTIVMAAACIGFLPYNFRKRKKMFLGDAGSTFLGFMLATIALAGNWAEGSRVRLMVPILVLGVPIFDMMFTTILRIRDGKVKTFVEWLKYAGKDHFHHYLVEIGLKPRWAVIFIYALTITLGISAVMVSRGSTVTACLTLLQSAIIFWIIATLIVVGRRRCSGWD
jgi:UDP-GlcNAc:undecaprenyl-phosphate/decaprenyl-phosphate GlcNAc-1-phosphate transferase